MTAEVEIDQGQQDPAGAAVARAAAIMARLRGPDGCPWDREQTFDSIQRHTLEETYEVFDAIERRAWPELRDELGDLLLQVLFYAQMAAEAGYFNLREIADGLSAKLIRRHPHIFAGAVATDAGEVLRNWEQIKREERRAAAAPADALPKPMLDRVPRSLPALMEARKLGAEAAKIGFDWPDAQGPLAKVREEIAEVDAATHGGDDDALELEMGDLLFSAVNLARHLHIDPEQALRRTNAKFRARVAHMETAAGGEDALHSLESGEKERLWEQAKAANQLVRETAPASGAGDAAETSSSRPQAPS